MVVQGKERRAMNTLVVLDLTKSNSSASSLYTALTKYMTVVLLSLMATGSLPVTERKTPLIRIISSASTVRICNMTMKLLLVFSMIAPFSRTCFVRIPMTRVWGGHHIKQCFFPNISQIKKTISNILIVFFK